VKYNPGWSSEGETVMAKCPRIPCRRRVQAVQVGYSENGETRYHTWAQCKCGWKMEKTEEPNK